MKIIVSFLNKSDRLEDSLFCSPECINPSYFLVPLLVLNGIHEQGRGSVVPIHVFGL
jgi:hypothetical protein